VKALAERTDPALARWIDAEVSFPRSMVDSITPAADEALRSGVASALALVDAVPVQREPYAQWVLEDRFCNGRPRLERVGVIFSDDVAGHEQAKLRLLNGAHSTLAYLGLLRGWESVAEAMQDQRLACFIDTLMRNDIAPTLPPIPGFDPTAYIDAILARFRNPAVFHRLSQIAWDGSQKLPVRILPTIGDALSAGRRIDRLCVPLAAWISFVRRQAASGAPLVDPMDAELRSAGAACTGDPYQDVARFLAIDAVFASLSRVPEFVEALEQASARLADADALAVSRALDVLAATC
jgi:fructuronate reductase